jgi:hypothetical protein
MLFLCMCLYHWYISHEEQACSKVEKEKSFCSLRWLLVASRKEIELRMKFSVWLLAQNLSLLFYICLYALLRANKVIGE